MDDTAVDFLLENLKQLINGDYSWICNNIWINAQKDQIKSFHEEVLFLRNFLEDTEDKRYEHEQLKKLAMRIGDAAYRANDIVDSFVARAVINSSDAGPLRLVNTMEEVMHIKGEVTEIYAKKMFGIGVLPGGNYSDGISSSRANTTIIKEGIVVGLEDEAKTIIERLMEDQKRLDITSIVGMGGLGKTTLAQKVYNDPCIVYHFYIRAWIYVSQTYSKRDLLLGFFKSASLLTDRTHEMSDEKLREELYRCLKGRRYLIVIDDIWNTGPWEYLRRSFPNDNNGSKILVTSRLTDVILSAKSHFLRFLTEEESWRILQHKVFGGILSPELIEIGKQIVRKCQGLPLAVVVIAGVLAKKSPNQWKEVAESVSSYIGSDSEEFMEILALSYNNLPYPLKVCFLYVGAFPEYYEIPVQKLMCLWMAEGFIKQTRQKRLEEVAESYLIDLIDRSLLTVSQKRSDGGIKACRIHDLLRDLCFRKAMEERFRHQNLRSGDRASSSFKHSSPFTRSYLSFSIGSKTNIPFGPDDTLKHFTHKPFQLLRVLDLWSSGKTIFYFPVEIGWLVHLRYLALRVLLESLPSSISDLWNLETLCLGGLSTALTLPYNFGKMVKLRHLYIKRHTSIPLVKEPTNYMYPFVLVNLQFVSTLLLHGASQQVLSRIPMIRKLGCIFMESWNGAFPELQILNHLETLKVVYRRVIGWPSRFPSTFKFPSNLKKLTLSRFRFPWTEMSTIGRLPNLEVLKLLEESFKGPMWETSDGEFLRLRYLKFQDLDIEQWNADASQFPALRKLVVVRCKRLEEIPIGLGDISALEMIEVNSSSCSTTDSARRIQQEQQSMGNDGFKISIVLPHSLFH